MNKLERFIIGACLIIVAMLLFVLLYPVLQVIFLTLFITVIYVALHFPKLTILATIVTFAYPVGNFVNKKLFDFK